MLFSFTKMLKTSTSTFISFHTLIDVLSQDARDGRFCVGGGCVPSLSLSWIRVRYYT